MSPAPGEVAGPSGGGRGWSFLVLHPWPPGAPGVGRGPPRGQQHEGADAAVDDRREHRRGLDAELPRVAEERAVGHAVERLLREHAGQQRADRPADAVRGHDVERVIEPRARAPDQREVARNRRDRAERERAHRADEPGRGRDRDQPDHDRRRGADRGRLA